MQDNLHHVDSQDKDTVNMAAANFLESLAQGHSVILQDAAILQDRYPNHRLFNLPCFRPATEGRQASLLRQAAYKAETLVAQARSIADNLKVTST